jgi:hypothetical protein
MQSINNIVNKINGNKYNSPKQFLKLCAKLQEASSNFLYQSSFLSSTTKTKFNNSKALNLSNKIELDINYLTKILSYDYLIDNNDLYPINTILVLIWLRETSITLFIDNKKLFEFTKYCYDRYGSTLFTKQNKETFIYANLNKSSYHIISNNKLNLENPIMDSKINIAKKFQYIIYNNQNPFQDYFKAFEIDYLSSIKPKNLNDNSKYSNDFITLVNSNNGSEVLIDILKKLNYSDETIITCLSSELVNNNIFNNPQFIFSYFINRENFQESITLINNNIEYLEDIIISGSSNMVTKNTTQFHYIEEVDNFCNIINIQHNLIMNSSQAIDEKHIKACLLTDKPFTNKNRLFFDLYSLSKNYINGYNIRDIDRLLIEYKNSLSISKSEEFTMLSTIRKYKDNKSAILYANNPNKLLAYLILLYSKEFYKKLKH